MTPEFVFSETSSEKGWMEKEKKKGGWGNRRGERHMTQENLPRFLETVLLQSVADSWDRVVPACLLTHTQLHTAFLCWNHMYSYVR